VLDELIAPPVVVSLPVAPEELVAVAVAVLVEVAEVAFVAPPVVAALIEPAVLVVAALLDADCVPEPVSWPSPQAVRKTKIRAILRMAGKHSMRPRGWDPYVAHIDMHCPGA
jgi:hypothetical protein